jgi:hypothetical protein
MAVPMNSSSSEIWYLYTSRQGAMSGKTNIQINFRIYVVSHKIITNVPRNFVFEQHVTEKK